MEEVRIEKLVNGGQGLATLPSGKKILVWGALPGELVSVRIGRTKKSFAVGFTEQVIEPSKDRIEAQEANYLATSPWQILDFDAENRWKETITTELFTGQKLDVDFGSIQTDGQQWHYRNKMEYSFWGDDDGVHLALHKRGSAGKDIIDGSALAMPAIDQAARGIVRELNRLKVRAGDLKTLIIRCSQDGKAAAALFIKVKSFPTLSKKASLEGLAVYYSEPKSPASVPTKLLYALGDTKLTGTVAEVPLHYEVLSFFQVNVPMARRAIKKIAELAGNNEPIIDLYAGVGTIGLSLGKPALLIESDEFSVKMAEENARGTSAKVIHAPAEKALEHLQSESTVIVDPPRAGLHPKLVDALLDKKPRQIIYMSCNPATQARDVALLAGVYNISGAGLYNFFPRTPHIESIINLERKA